MAWHQPNSIISIAHTKSRPSVITSAMLPLHPSLAGAESSSRFDRRICRISFREAIAVFATLGRARAHSALLLFSPFRKERKANQPWLSSISSYCSIGSDVRSGACAVTTTATREDPVCGTASPDLITLTSHALLRSFFAAAPLQDVCFTALSWNQFFYVKKSEASSNRLTSWGSSRLNDIRGAVVDGRLCAVTLFRK